MTLAIATSRRFAPAVQTGGVMRAGMIGRYHSLGRAGVMLSEDVTNLVINPIFGNATIGYSGTGSTIAASDEWVQWGRYSGKVITNNAAASEGLYNDVSGYAAGSATTFSCDLMGRGTVVLRIDDGVGTTDSAAITLSTTAQRKFVTRTLDASATRCRCMVLTSTQQAAVFYTDGWQCITSAWDAPLASGSNADSAWSSTEHGSTSTRTNPAFYYAAADIGDTCTFTMQFRTPPQFLTTRADDWTLFQLYNGTDSTNRIRVYFDYTAGHEGHLMFYFVDAAAVTTTADSGVALTADTDYWLFATIAKTSATASALSLYYAAAGVGGATALSTALSASAATGVRQSETTRLYIGTHTTAGACLDGVVYNWAVIPDVALTAAQCLAILTAGASPPYTGTKYYGGMWLGYDAEELNECVMVGDTSDFAYRRATGSDGPEALEEEDDPQKTLANITQSIDLHIEGTSKADLDDKVAAINRILGDARQGREAWWYEQPGGGKQLRAKLWGGALALGRYWNTLMREQFIVVDAELSLTREPLWRGQEQQLYEDRAITNYSASALTSPIPVFNPGDEPAPLRLIMQNPSTDAWGWAEYAIGRLFGTVPSPLNDFNGTAHTNALSAAHSTPVTLGSTYANICSVAITTDRWPRYYRVLIHAAVTSVTYAFDFVITTASYTDWGEAAVIGRATNLSLTTNNVLQTLDLGVTRWPGESNQLGNDTRTNTLYIYAKVATGTPDMSVDYIRLLPCDSYGRLSFLAGYLASDAAPFAIWDGETGIATTATAAFAVFESICVINGPTGVPPILAPGWNSLYIWGCPNEVATEATYAATMKLGQSTFIPRYRSVKGAI